MSLIIRMYLLAAEWMSRQPAGTSIFPYQAVQCLVWRPLLARSRIRRWPRRSFFSLETTTIIIIFIHRGVKRRWWTHPTIQYQHTDDIMPSSIRYQILAWNRRKLLIGLFTVSTVYLLIQSLSPFGGARFQSVE